MLSVRTALGLTFHTFLISITFLRSVNAGTTVTTIDNQDPGIKYSGGWSPISNSDSHIMLTRVQDATATYSFTGVGVAVFGQGGPPGVNATVSTYSIDGATTTYTLDPGLTTEEYNMKFYDSGPNLFNGPHTLVITNLNTNAWYWFISLQITASDPSTTLTSTTQTSSPSPDTSTPVVVATSAQISSQSTTPVTTGTSFSTSGASTSSSTTSAVSTTQASEGSTSGSAAVEESATQPTLAVTLQATHSSDSSKITTGSLVGAALGGVAFLGLLIIGGLVCLWRKRRATGKMPITAFRDEGKASSSAQLPEGEIIHGHVAPYQVDYFPPGAVSNREKTPRFSAPESPPNRDSYFAANMSSGSNSNMSSSHALLSTSPLSSPPTTAHRSGGVSEPRHSMSNSTPYETLSPKSSGRSSSVTRPLLGQSSTLTPASSQGTRRSRDGGIRLAGGHMDDEEIDDSVTLPPEYTRY